MLLLDLGVMIAGSSFTSPDGTSWLWVVILPLFSGRKHVLKKRDTNLSELPYMVLDHKNRIIFTRKSRNGARIGLGPGDLLPNVMRTNYCTFLNASLMSRLFTPINLAPMCSAFGSHVQIHDLVQTGNKI